MCPIWRTRENSTDTASVPRLGGHVTSEQGGLSRTGAFRTPLLPLDLRMSFFLIPDMIFPWPSCAHSFSLSPWKEIGSIFPSGSRGGQSAPQLCSFLQPNEEIRLSASPHTMCTPDSGCISDLHCTCSILCLSHTGETPIVLARFDTCLVLRVPAPKGRHSAPLALINTWRWPPSPSGHCFFSPREGREQKLQQGGSLVASESRTSGI